MLPSFASQRTKKLKNVLDVATNVVVVLFAVVAIGVLVKNYLAPQTVTSGGIMKGSVFPEIPGIDYKHASRTLILALNVDCRYCTRSVPFYNSLAEARNEKPGQFNLVAAFINPDAGLVQSYAEDKRLSVPTIAGVDLDKLGIRITPTLVPVDSTGTVLESGMRDLQLGCRRN